MTESPGIETDVAIIGAGPVGLFAVFQLGMLGLKAHVFDALEAIGGQCTALYPEKPIYDIPAYPAIDAAALVERLEAQAAPFHPTYHLDEQVLSLTPDGAHWLVGGGKGTKLRVRAVLIAAGVGAFGPNRPPIEGLAEFEGKSIFYAVRNKEMFRDKRVVIAGGGDSAVDWALALQPIAARVMVVHRRDKFRAAPESVNKLNALVASGGIELVVPTQLAGLEGTEGRLARVIVADLEGQERALDADFLLPFYGLAMNLGPILDWGLAQDARHHIEVDPAHLETSRDGIYAIGDIAAYPGKLKLILCGFSEAAMAAHAIRKRLFPGQEMHFEYSTTKGVPGG